jgi:hypothetical protein
MAGLDPATSRPRREMPGSSPGMTRQMLFRDVISLFSGLALAACSVVGIRSGTEEPAYTVVQSIGPSLEIRQYGARLAADTVVPGDEIAARSEGFRRIAAYIFGANHGAAKIDMTAPVSTAPSETIAMTAPVAQAKTPEGWRVRFFMPAKYTMDTLPGPNDPRVKIVTVPAETYAVYRYSGTISAGEVAHAHDELLRLLAGTGYVPSGEVLNWFYDPPWTLPPLRRNEAAVVVTKP